VLGNGCVLRYAFHRDGAALSYAATVGLRTDLGTILAATRLPGPDSLVGATEDGALLLLDGSALSGEPLVRETLPVP
jgi:hypothetical protein